MTDGSEGIAWPSWLGLAISFAAGANILAIGIVVLSRLTTYDPIAHQVVRADWLANSLAFVHHAASLLTWAILTEGWRTSARRPPPAVAVALGSGACLVALVLFARGVLPVAQHDEFMHSEIAWPLLVATLFMTLGASVLLPAASRAIRRSPSYYLRRAAAALALGIAIYAAKGVVGIPRDAALAAEIVLVILIPAYCCASGVVSRSGNSWTLPRVACGGLLFVAMALAAFPG